MPRTAAGGRYRLAPSLDRLFDEVNTTWPKRDRRTDGWLGDISHQARTSEHNPDDRGVVHAIDIDTDRLAKAEKNRLLKAVIGHPAVWYVIHEGRIWSRTYGWRARKYTGPNPHAGHIHVSIRLDRAAEGWAGSWLAKASRPAKRWRLGDEGEALKKWQRLLGVEPDGVYGPATAAAVNRIKREQGWRPDGVLGPGVRKILAGRGN